MHPLFLLVAFAAISVPLALKGGCAKQISRVPTLSKVKAASREAVERLATSADAKPLLQALLPASERPFEENECLSATRRVGASRKHASFDMSGLATRRLLSADSSHGPRSPMYGKN